MWWTWKETVLGFQSLLHLQNTLLNPFAPILTKPNVSSTIDLIAAEGYPSETHSVTTEDGYILSLHRIPGNASSVPVLYLHGYESSSAEVVLRGREDSLGFLLSDQGYDVWLINFRGNVYSRNHTDLSPDDHWGPFWNFTWWEMGSIDLPEVLNYILESTGKKELQIAGHSQGITALYVMLDQHPALAANIALVSAMAPLAYNSHTQGMLRWCAQFLADLPFWASQSEFLAPSTALQTISSEYCHENSTTQIACYDFLFFVTGLLKLTHYNKSYP